MTIEGEIIVKRDAVTFDSGFKKQEIVIKTNDQYPQELKVDFNKDNTAKLSGFNVGDNVSVSINLNGNEYQGKYYVSLTGWKIAKVITNQSKTPVSNTEDEPPF